MRIRQKDIQAELQQIAADNNGFLRPEAVVEYAKNPETALHHKFTWDDTEAAYNWRLVQARMVIRNVRIVMSDQKPIKFRAYVSMKDDRYNDLGYRPTIKVMEDDALRQVLLEEAKEEMEIFMTKYAHLQELSQVIQEMRKVIGVPRRKRQYKKPAQGGKTAVA
jgi:hypothetical protein